MPTLSVLHSQFALSDKTVLDFIRGHPTWDLIKTSTVRGGTRPYFWATSGRGPRVIPEEWSKSEIDAFHTLHAEMDLLSADLEQQEYEDIIALLQSRSTDLTPQVV